MAPNCTYNRTMNRSRLFAPLVVAGLALTACGSDTSTTDAGPDAAPTGSIVTNAAGLRRVSADAAKATVDSPTEGLVILDVRTPEEFAEGHIEGAIMIDFYRDDFAAELAKLDPDVPYVLYCRSGNRSGQTLAMMEGLDFQDVQDVDGGVIGWQNAGLPLVGG